MFVIENSSKDKIKIMKSLGASVIVVKNKDKNGGYLASRIELINKMLLENNNYIWLNQYANRANPCIHRDITAKEIDNTFNNIDYLVIGAGTTGTLMGCSEYFKEKII
ncbi:pyridoxal-phosphate dependent enzyme [Vibrio sp. PP-XX7]